MQCTMYPAVRTPCLLRCAVALQSSPGHNAEKKITPLAPSPPFLSFFFPIIAFSSIIHECLLSCPSPFASFFAPVLEGTSSHMNALFLSIIFFPINLFYFPVLGDYIFYLFISPCWRAHVSFLAREGGVRGPGRHAGAAAAGFAAAGQDAHSRAAHPPRPHRVC